MIFNGESWYNWVSNLFGFKYPCLVLTILTIDEIITGTTIPGQSGTGKMDIEVYSPFPKLNNLCISTQCSLVSYIGHHF